MLDENKIISFKENPETLLYWILRKFQGKTEGVIEVKEVLLSKTKK